MKHLVEITPDKARRMLSTYRNKAVPDKQKVERFKRIIISGRWNAERYTRILMIKGELRNGKHRLTAIAETGIPTIIKLDEQ